MKGLNLLFILTVLISLTACDKNNPENIDVDNYIELLESGQYDANELPDFTHTDIPALLRYRNDNKVITDFPHNPISSMYGPECKLGVYVLWTIESIRAVAIDSEYLIGRFPSLNPVLAFRDAEELDMVNDDESHEVAAKAYYDWWENNRDKNFDAFKDIDPLAQTAYRWR